MRVGTIIEAEIFKEAKDPAFKMIINFGEFGILISSAEITELYLQVGRSVLATARIN